MAPDSYYTEPKDVKTRTGAGGVVTRVDPATRAVKIALIRDQGDHSYVLPKGGVDDDENFEQAARREIEEEAGFTQLELLAELGVGERLNSRRTTWQTTHYFLFRTDQETATPTEHHHGEVAWFSLEELPDMYWREQRKLIEDNRDRILALTQAAGRG
jgi:8-oxo-dGTP pyrophosphatase MutT (NUDIX family)